MDALFAFVIVLFALAQKLCKRKNGPAFQASSPKTFKGRPPGRPFFLGRARRGTSGRRIVVDLANGCIFAFPAQRVQELEGAKEAEIADVAIAGAGFGLHWPSLDADLSLRRLMSGVFGTKAWMSELARRAGSVSTPAKAAAARANGRKEGRPPKAA